MTHDPAHDPLGCLDASLWELHGAGPEERTAAFNHAQQALAHLHAMIEQLQRDRAEARAWAWSEFHRDYDARWLPTVETPALDPPWDWDLPAWMTDPTEPSDQAWWVPKPAREAGGA